MDSFPSLHVEEDDDEYWENEMENKMSWKKRQGGMAANDQGRKTAMGALTQNEEDSSSSRGVDNERKTPLFKKTLWSCLSSFRVHFR